MKKRFFNRFGKRRDETKYNMITSFVTNYKGKRQCEKDFAKYIKNGNNPIQSKKNKNPPQRILNSLYPLVYEQCNYNLIITNCQEKII